MFVESLFAALSAGAVLVAQESVKLATKQAYERLRIALSKVLSADDVKAIERGDASAGLLESAQRELDKASELRRGELRDALEEVLRDRDLAACLPGEIIAKIEKARLTGDVRIEAEPHISRIDAAISEIQAGNIVITAKKKT